MQQEPLTSLVNLIIDGGQAGSGPQKIVSCQCSLHSWYPSICVELKRGGGKIKLIPMT